MMMIIITIIIMITSSTTPRTAAAYPYRHLRPRLVVVDAVVADEQHVGVVPVPRRSELLQVPAVVAEVVDDALLRTHNHVVSRRQHAQPNTKR
jgi:hypothetical protein